MVLWSLHQGLDVFPESPPPGLVTIPNVDGVPKVHYTLAGYHPAGTRAIRIDMLERLADMLRLKDSRAGFEAVPEMLSITGLSLDHFADLMAGLGYKGEKTERPRTKAAPAPVPLVEAPVNPVPEEVSLLVPEVAADAAADAPAPEVEVVYTFTWAPKPRPRPERPAGQGGPRRDRGPRAAPSAEGQAAAPAEGQAPPAPRADRPRGDRPRGDRPRPDKPQGEGHRGDRKAGGDRKPAEGGHDKRAQDRAGPKGGGKPDAKGDRPRAFEARPPRAEKPIDPDNPFAALLALKGKV
jgi:ATP-dependent RNA helicase SUPV3L1/SUV3